MMPTTTNPTLTNFSLFASLAPELRLKVWQFACASRIVTVRYDSKHDRCISNATPPALLSATHESRAEALRYYQLSFGTHSNAAHIYFNPYRDVLYLPRHRMMGYDETLRDFRNYLAQPELLDQVGCLALDHVDVEVKRPWESYNKAALIREFPRLEEMLLVLCEPGQSKVADIKADVVFTEPREDPEELLMMWADFRQAFIQEQKLLEEVCREVGKECVQYVLPTVRIRAKAYVPR
ncbi:hypothetical protein PVAG01_08237 [Phlyctema vagabunda]|uniref:2EXR domain-containing protein n=1 Tax=Phlyctema vagabunda TaxID=108571 RepID=A0ABR4P8U4_9HELO